MNLPNFIFKNINNKKIECKSQLPKEFLYIQNKLNLIEKNSLKGYQLNSLKRLKMIKSKWNIKYLNSSLDNRFLIPQIFIMNNKLYIKRKHIKTDILIF